MIDKKFSVRINVKSKRVRVTVVAVQEQEVLRILSVCVCVCVYVCVALVIQHAKRILRPELLPVVCVGLSCFFHVVSVMVRFSEEGFENKTCVLMFCTIFI
jgi:hypothetical protein